MSKILLRGLVVITFVVAAAAFLFPIFAKAKSGSYRNRCYSNLFQVAQTISLYANDSDGVLPSADRWMDALDRYTKWPNFQLHDPEGVKAGDYGYAFRDKASALNLSKVDNLKGYPVVFDSILMQRNAHSELGTLPHPGRHRGRDSIVYLDGHAKSLPMP